MTLEVTPHEATMLLRALEEHVTRRADQGLSTAEAAALVQKLKKLLPPEKPGATVPQTPSQY
jgi:hypothetical protein